METDTLLAIFQPDEYVIQGNKLDPAYINKHKLMNAYVLARGCTALACEIAGLGYSTFCKHRKNDPEFARALEDIEELSISWAEAKLNGFIEAGSEKSLHFLLGRLSRKFRERKEITGRDGEAFFPVSILSNVYSDNGDKASDGNDEAA